MLLVRKESVFLIEMMKIITLLLIFASVANSARILGVFPYPSHSHQVVFKAICKELAKRGHEVIIFTPTLDKEKSKIPTYTEIHLEEAVKSKQRVNFFTTGKDGLWTYLRNTYKLAVPTTEAVLAHPVMQQLLSPNNTQKFDLLFVQYLFYDALLALSVHFDAPVIGISSLPLLALQNFMLANPLEPAYTPDALLGSANELNLWGRVVNAYYILRQIHIYTSLVVSPQDELVKKYFGDHFPSVMELNNRTVAFFTYSHQFFNEPRANLPHIIYIGGCRDRSSNKTLPKDLEKILDDSKQGVIYFSLGSNLQSKDLPPETRDTFLKVFSELPYTILWKFESDDMSNMPKNVLTRKWLPQEAVLAHPNVVLFMYQGGLQSTEEAIVAGVPVIGFPLFCDQIGNIDRLKKAGVGEKFHLIDLDKETLKGTIIEMIRNPRYKENALKFRALLADTQNTPMETAIWWTEHVIRHKGAPHLYSPSRNLSLYQVWLLDILAIFVVSSIVALYCIYLIIRLIVKKAKHAMKSEKPEKSSKKQQ